MFVIRTVAFNLSCNARFYAEPRGGGSPGRKRQLLIGAFSEVNDVCERIYLNRCNDRLRVMVLPVQFSAVWIYDTASVTLPSPICAAWCLTSGRNDPVRRDRNESRHYARGAVLYLLIRSGSDCDRWSCREAPSVRRAINMSHLHVVVLFKLRLAVASVLLFANCLVVKNFCGLYQETRLVLQLSRNKKIFFMLRVTEGRLTRSNCIKIFAAWQNLIFFSIPDSINEDFYLRIF